MSGSRRKIPKRNTRASAVDRVDAESKPESLRAKLAKFGDDVFRQAFPTLSAIADSLESKKKDEVKDNTRQTAYRDRAMRNSESMASSLAQLVIEQGKSIALLKELLTAIKGLATRQGPESPGLSDMLSSGRRGRRSKLVAAATAAGAAVGGYALYNALRSDEPSTSAESSEQPAAQPEAPSQVETPPPAPTPATARIRASRGTYSAGGLQVTYSASRDGRYTVGSNEVDEGTYRRFIETINREVPLDDFEAAQAKQRDVINILTEIQSGRAAPAIPQQASNTTAPVPTAAPTTNEPRIAARGATPRISGAAPEQRQGLAAPAPAAVASRQSPEPATANIDALGQRYAEARTARVTADQDLASFRERAGPSKTRESRDGLSYEEYYDKPEDNEQFQALQNRAAAARNQEETIQRQHQFAVVGVQPRRDRLGRVSGMDESGRYSAPNESQIARMIELLRSRYNYTDEQLQRLPGSPGNSIIVGNRSYPMSVVGLFERHANEDLSRASTAVEPASGGQPQGAGSVASEGGDATRTDAQSGPTGDLSFAPGVDPRIGNDIAQKVERIKGVASDMVITSGFRDPQRNAAAGGARNSAHLRGNAVDIQFRGNEQDTVKVIEAASAAGVGGIGVYRPGWLHLDTESRRVWGPDFSDRSIPEWARPAMQAHASGQRPSQSPAQPVETEPSTPSLTVEGAGSSQSSASPAESTPTSGSAVASASQENAVAERTPVPPTVVTSEAGTSGQASPGASTPGTFSSPDDPGSVEPADSADRYARLFNMAA